jgi:hypothetical protein
MLLWGCAHRSAGEAANDVAGGPSPAPAAGALAPGDTAAIATGPFAALEHTRASLAGFRTVQDSVQSGGLKSIWVAYVDRDSVRYIHETIDAPVYGRRTNEYLFIGGRLRVFASSGPHALNGPPDERGPYQLRIAFDPTGVETAAEKFVNDVSTKREDVEPPAALGRAEWLLAQVRASRAKAR